MLQIWPGSLSCVSRRCTNGSAETTEEQNAHISGTPDVDGTVCKYPSNNWW